MKTTLITALSLMMAGAAVTHAQTLTFDSQAAFNNNFTLHSGALNYSSANGGLGPSGTTTVLTSLGNESYNPGEFLTESISMTFSMAAFGVNSSVGLYTRADDSMTYTSMTGILGMVNMTNANRVRLRLVSGSVHAGTGTFVDLNFDLGTALSTSQKFVFTLQQQNIAVGTDLQAQFRVSLTNEDGTVTYGDSLWRNVSGLNTYTTEGAIGMRVYQNPVASGVVVHSFSPHPDAIPEPSTVALLGAGLALGGWMRRRQTARRA